MAIKLHKAGYEHALSLIKRGLEVEYFSQDWSEEQASDDEAVKYLNTHTLNEYGLWFLGIDTDADPEDRSRYVYPHGDFNVVHKVALEVAQEEATDNGDRDIAQAAQRLLDLIEQMQESEK